MITCMKYLPRADGLTYTVVCMKFPKGNPIGTKTAADNALKKLGTERVSTPSVMPKVMYGKGTTGKLVAVQMEIYGCN